MDRFDLFPTPLLVFDLPDLDDVNRELGERLRAEAESSPGVRRSNEGGWHSVPDLALRADPCCRTIVRAFVDHVGDAVHGLAASQGREMDSPSCAEQHATSAPVLPLETPRAGSAGDEAPCGRNAP